VLLHETDELGTILEQALERGVGEGVLSHGKWTREAAGKIQTENGWSRMGELHPSSLVRRPNDRDRVR